MSVSTALCLTPGQLLKEECLHMLSPLALQTISGNSQQVPIALPRVEVGRGGGAGGGIQTGSCFNVHKEFHFHVSYVVSFHVHVKFEELGKHKSVKTSSL